MLLYKDIVRDGHEVLKMNANDVKIPLSKEDEDTLIAMNEYLMNGYDDEFIANNDIRPGVGIAAPQIGISKKMFCIATFDEKGDFHNYCVINPKIISHSEELIAAEAGEGCLSVKKRSVEVKRPSKITVEALNEKGEKITFTAEHFYAREICHEVDHLDGILIVDREECN